MTSFEKSERHLSLAEKVIPLGSQTFSKSKTQYPVGISPLYAKYAVGSLIQDLDALPVTAKLLSPTARVPTDKVAELPVIATVLDTPTEPTLPVATVPSSCSAMLTPSMPTEPVAALPLNKTLDLPYAPLPYVPEPYDPAVIG